jgi:IS30 family transposase
MSQITESQRYTIMCLLKEGFKQIEISRAISKDKSVISRELKRNSDKRSGLYKADLANIKYKRRQKEKHKYRKFTLEMQTKIEALLKEYYSPEQVVGFLSDVGEAVVSIERIYQHIWIDKAKGGTLYLGLRRQGRKYRK